MQLAQSEPILLLKRLGACTVPISSCAILAVCHPPFISSSLSRNTGGRLEFEPCQLIYRARAWGPAAEERGGCYSAEIAASSRGIREFDNRSRFLPFLPEGAEAGPPAKSLLVFPQDLPNCIEALVAVSVD